MGIIQSLFGGSSSKSSSVNTNNPMLTGAYGGSTAYTGQAGGLLGSLLGVPGSSPASGDQGWQNYMRNAGFDWQNDQGQRGVIGSQAAHGLLNSGSTQKSLVNYSQGLKSSMFGDYMKSLLGFGNLGLGAGQILSDSGRTSSESSSKDTGGLGQAIGKVAGALFFSDRRLKRDIKRIGKLKNGLPWYEFNYLSDTLDTPPREGLMSDDVRKLIPEAVITKSGFDMVDYSLAMEG